MIFFAMIRVHVVRLSGRTAWPGRLICPDGSPRGGGGKPGGQEEDAGGLRTEGARKRRIRPLPTTWRSLPAR